MLESDEFKSETKYEGYTEVQSELIKEVMTLSEEEAGTVINLLSSLLV